MAKVDFTLHWDGKELSILNRDLLVEQCQQYQPGTYLDGTLGPQFQWKTGSQLGYLYAEIGVKAMMGYNARGVKVKDKVMAIELLKLEEEIDFTEKVIDVFSEAVIARVPKRLSGDKGSRHELSEFMNDCIMFIETELGVIVSDPAGYKKLKKA